jgi:hypothetical protein
MVFQAFPERTVPNMRPHGTLRKRRNADDTGASLIRKPADERQIDGFAAENFTLKAKGGFDGIS